MNRPARPSLNTPQHGARGVALLEALVALLIMAFGMLALVGLQSNLRHSSDLAKQRGEAVRLAQQEMEKLRSYSQLATPNPANANTLAFDDIATPGSDGVVATFDNGTNATFTVTRTVVDSVEPIRKSIRVEVSWLDRSEGTQTVSLDSVLSRADPLLGGALGIAPVSSPLRRPANREASIPTNAKDLGDGSSAFKPLASGDVVWVFNNLTGVITGICNIPSTPTSNLAAADVAACRGNAFGYLLSGFVRFSDHSPSDPGNPIGQAIPMGLNLALTTSSSMMPSYQCFSDTPLTTPATQTYVSYYCVVYPNSGTPPIWSGQLTLTGIPLTGQSNGSGTSARNICRYSADYDGNGSISNAEHPLSYSKVSGALTRQNFLVIPGSENCPAGHAIDASLGFFSNTATVLHQPNGVR
ncbi:type IV pilus modification PilV family protein [Roseateles koreensis]|uniref:Type IV pilus assembly protein PilV n=1 Tax=Roseateles koreensis TaxID=2987526 RepID=A0ABT5KRH3_9BURK|nr:hypothetical protein [Roseateles koreensis]MDC8784476.1 hypothetical protein [Roseateles koreensis]